MYVTRLVFFNLVCMAAMSVVELLHPLSDEFIDLINKEGKWRAGRNFPPDTPMEYIRKLMGTNIDFSTLKKLPIVKHNERTEDLPESFDPRDKWPNCPTLNEIRDQGQCGACWAFAAVETMTDRVCIYSNGTTHFHFSAEDLLTCNARHNGCDGGSSEEAWLVWVDVGLVSGGNFNSHQGCKPYSVPPCKNHLKNCTNYQDTPLCVKTCEKGYNISYEKDKRRGKRYYVVEGEENIMAELYKNGPVTGSYLVYEDFANYKGGVYQHVKGKALGMHSVKTIGWGVENGTKYWLIANSWGTDFGDKGFFKIERGVNESSFMYLDKTVITGEPLIDDYFKIYK